jgi:Ca2+/H+ antiporter, TMEM165/GDT1 family
MRRRSPARWILLFLIVGPIAIFIFGTVVMWLWNNALAPALHIPTITFWQGLGILVLSKILFGSFHGEKEWSRNGTGCRLKKKKNSKQDGKTAGGRGDISPGTMNLQEVQPRYLTV